MVQRLPCGQGVDWRPLGVMVYEVLLGYPTLDSEDDNKPHDEIVIGEVNSPWWMLQDAA